jgi:hypothetical protein
VRLETGEEDKLTVYAFAEEKMSFKRHAQALFNRSII